MKRLLSIFLAVLLLFPALAMAIDTQVGTTYVNEDPYYSYTYPEEWVMINKDTVSLLMGLAANTLASGYADAIKNMGIVMFMAPDFQEFAIVMTQYLGMDISAELLISLLPMLAETVSAQSPGTEIKGDGELIQQGGNTFAKILVYVPVAEGNMVIAMYITTANENLYMIFCYKAEQEADFAAFESSLASFSMIK